MKTISISKQYYHLIPSIQEWCEEKFGQGAYYPQFQWERQDTLKLPWYIDSVFGNTTFYFQAQDQLDIFKQEWEKYAY